MPVTAAVCYGLSEGLEMGASVPVYASDEAWGAGPAGDISLGVKYLYESARGGTGLAFTGSLVLPTGESPRDAGSRASAGLCTSTVYRLVRLSLAASYFAAGGDDPFSSRITDGIDFGCCAASYLDTSLQAFGGARGGTGSQPEIAAGLVYGPAGWLEAGLTASVTLEDEPLLGISASVAMSTGAL